jgi:hypothetical protein
VVIAQDLQHDRALDATAKLTPNLVNLDFRGLGSGKY